MSDDETYLGDGLYASFDGYMLTLRAPRDGSDHWVGLEPEILQAFLEYACKFKLTEIIVRGVAKQMEESA